MSGWMIFFKRIFMPKCDVCGITETLESDGAGHILCQECNHNGGWK